MSQQVEYATDDLIQVIEGKFAGRSGVYLKSCSNVFPKYCRVKLDLKGREREAKVLMIRKAEIKLRDEKGTV